MIEIRKRLDGLLIFNNEVTNLQSQEDQFQNTKQEFEKLDQSQKPLSYGKLRRQKACDKEQEKVLKLLPDLMQQIQDQIPDPQNLSIEVNSLISEQTHLQTMANLFQGAEEVSEYLLLDHFINLNDNLTFEMQCLSRVVAENKKLFFPARNTRKTKTISSPFYSRRIKQYYEYLDSAIAYICQIQQKMVEKKQHINARNLSIYL